MIIAKETGKDFKPMPSGSHIARCMAVISLGTQASTMFPSSFKIMLMWEVPGEPIEIDGKPAPMTIQKEYTLSLSEKANLRHDLQSWRGKVFTKEELAGFDVVKVLGQPCMLSVVQKTSGKGKTYSVVAGISGVPKGVQCHPAWHKPVSYEIEDGEDDNFRSLPEWIRKKIMVCEEWTLGSQQEPEPTVDADPQPEPPDMDTTPF